MRAHKQTDGETFKIIKCYQEFSCKCEKKYDVKRISNSFIAREML